MTNRLAILLALVFPLGGTSSALGQPRPFNPDSALQVILSDLKGTPLPLQAAIEHARNNATAVRRAEATFLSALGTLRRERGVFDPSLFFTINYTDQEEPTASFFSGAPTLVTQQTTARGGLRWDLPIGTEFEISLNTIQLRTNSAFAFLNPQHTAFGSLTIRQPLLGGFHTSARKNLSKAEQELDAARARYDQEALAISAEVERRYWDLYAAERDYAVRILTRDQAEAFHKETELRARTGLIGPNQVANAQTFLAEQKILLLDQEEQLDRLSDQLASVIGVRPKAGTNRFITTGEPTSDFQLQPVEELVERALRENLGVLAAERDVEAMRSQASAAGWEALPNIDLVGSLGGSGIAGTAQNVIFRNDTLRTTRSGSFGDALSQVSRREFPNWSLGVEVSIPIGFRSGVGERDRLQAEVILAEQHYIERKRSLEEQVRANYRELFHGRRRLEAAKEGVAAAQEQVRIGLIEFQNGRSTAFELVRLGADFAVAQQRYSEALVRNAKAAITLKELTSGGYGTVNH